jgi:hypothetical protein
VGQKKLRKNVYSAVNQKKAFKSKNMCRLSGFGWGPEKYRDNLL